MQIQMEACGRRCLPWEYGEDGSGAAVIFLGLMENAVIGFDSLKTVLRRCSLRNRAVRDERMIRWIPLGEGWTKLNTDRASHGNPGLATVGGVLQDRDGNWCGGFALNIGICLVPLAKLWGVYYGIYIAWEKRVTRLELEVDSEIVVGFLKTGISESHPLSFLIRLCYGFLPRDWIVHISHMSRKLPV